MAHIQDYLAGLRRAGGRLSEAQMCNLFAQHILCGPLGYEEHECIVNPHADDDDTAEGVPDIVIRAPHNDDTFDWIVVEAKLNDDLLRDPERRTRLWADKRKYVRGETVYFLWLASRTVLVCDPTGEVKSGVYFDEVQEHLLQDQTVICTTDDAQVREHLDFISAEQARSLGFLERFREGELASRYLELNRETVEQLTGTLRGIIASLRSYLMRRWNVLKDEYREYQREKGKVEDHLDLMGDLIPPWEQELDRLAVDYQFQAVKELFEFAFPNFCRQQAYTRWEAEDRGQPEEEALADIFRTDAAYVIISRLLFVRFAEDQTDEAGKPLISPKISNGGLKLWRQLVGAGEPYIGKLVDLAFTQAGSVFEQVFSRTPFDALFSLDDREFDRVLLLVLYRLNAFSFERLERDLLGDLYQSLLPRDLRKKIGEFYTDLEVVEYILHRTGFVEAARTGAPTLLDPACGSGTFLVRAAYYLIEGARERGVGDAEILDLVSRCIHGLDINDFAVFIARVNLLFTCFDLMTNSHRDVAFQVHEANSLIGPGDAEQYTSAHGDGSPPPAWVTEGELLRRGRYEFVVGNPPYVRAERIPDADREAIQRAYSVIAQRNVDLAAYFVYRALDWLEEGGTFSMILPRAIADAGFARALRRELHTPSEGRPEVTVTEIAPLDWACHELFESDVVPLILTLRREARADDAVVRLVHRLRSKRDILQAGSGGLQARVAEVEWDGFAAAAGGQLWPLEVTSRDVRVHDRLRHFPTLQEHAVTRFGVKLGAQCTASDTAGARLAPLVTGADVFSYYLAPPRRFAQIEQAADRSLWAHAAWDSASERFHPADVNHPVPEVAVATAKIGITINGALLAPDILAAQDTVLLSVWKDDGLPAEALAGFLNSALGRWYAFVFLRAGVAGGGRRDYTIYPRTINSLPCPPMEPGDWLGSLAALVTEATGVAGAAAVLDPQLWEGAVEEVPPDATLSAWPIDWRAWAQRRGLSEAVLLVEREERDRLRLSRSIAITSDDPRVLDFLERHLPLLVQERGHITRRQAQSLALPDARAVPQIMTRYADSLEERDRARDEYLRLVEEIDEAVFDAFEMPDRMRRTVRRRMTEFPLNENAAKYRKPWEPTRRPPIKIFKPGERYH